MRRSISEIRSMASRSLVAAAACALALGGCVHTMEPVSSEQEQTRVELSVGDTVRVLTKDSQRRIFRIESIEPDALAGKDAKGNDVTAAYSDIVFIERRTFSPGRTAALSAAGVMATVLLIVTVEGAVPVFSGP
jgi:hypothetical protein